MIIYLSVIGVLFLLNIMFMVFGLRASRKLIEYEKFYSDSVDDFESIVEKYNELLETEVLMDSPEVQELRDLMMISRNTLLGYINAKEEKEEE